MFIAPWQVAQDVKHLLAQTCDRKIYSVSGNMRLMERINGW